MSVCEKQVDCAVCEYLVSGLVLMDWHYEDAFIIMIIFADLLLYQRRVFVTISPAGLKTEMFNFLIYIMVHISYLD